MKKKGKTERQWFGLWQWDKERSQILATLTSRPSPLSLQTRGLQQELPKSSCPKENCNAQPWLAHHLDAVEKGMENKQVTRPAFVEHRPHRDGWKGFFGTKSNVLGCISTESRAYFSAHRLQYNPGKLYKSWSQDRSPLPFLFFPCLHFLLPLICF